MIAIYLLAMSFGVVLVGASVLLGGHGLDKDVDHHVDGPGEHDVEHDIEHDAGHDADHGHGGALTEGSGHAFEKDLASWLPIFSLRFWSFGSAAFGATGAALWMIGLTDLISGVVAGLTGAGVGWAAAWLFRQLKTDTVSGDTRLDRLAGQEAKVLLAIREGGVGKIRVTTASGLLELPARTHDGGLLEAGSTVIVAEVRDGVADVTGLPRLRAVASRSSEGEHRGGS